MSLSVRRKESDFVAKNATRAPLEHGWLTAKEEKHCPSLNDGAQGVKDNHTGSNPHATREACLLEREKVAVQ